MVAPPSLIPIGLSPNPGADWRHAASERQDCWMHKGAQRWLGEHRVIDPPGALPQSASRLDAETPCQPEELEIAVTALQVDAASFRQIKTAVGEDAGAVAAHVEALIQRNGKLHNPVTGSGGMLAGCVAAAGSLFASPPPIGARIASLTSLTLTPLRIENIADVAMATGRLEVVGRAFLFGDCPWALLPADIDETAALTALDVAGAAPSVRRRTRPGDRVVVLGGGGRAGLLASIAARAAGASAVIAVDIAPAALARARVLGAATTVIEGDVRSPIDLMQKIGVPADLTVSCVDVAGAEPAAILCTAPDGRVLFFGMATSFSAACLTAEGLGRATTLEIGNGYAPGHAQETLALLRLHPEIAEWFAE